MFFSASSGDGITLLKTFIGYVTGNVKIKGLWHFYMDILFVNKTKNKNFVFIFTMLIWCMDADKPFLWNEVVCESDISPCFDIYKTIRIYHECEGRIENPSRGSPIGNTRHAKWWQSVITRDGFFYPILTRIMDSVSWSPLNTSFILEKL